MNQRVVTFVLAFFFGVSSLLSVCPEAYSLSAYQHAAFDGSMPDAELCGQMGHEVIHSICYRVLHDRLAISTTAFSTPGAGGVPSPALDVPVQTEPIFLTRFLPPPTESPPKLSLTVLLRVLRI